MTESECLQQIQATDRQGLISLWEAIKSRTTEQAGWLPGKAFELLILRAFELEGADVTWDITHCLTNASFEEGLLEKYRYCIEHGLPDKSLTA